MDLDQYERSPRIGRSLHIMDTVSGRISSESGLGDAYIQINDTSRIETNHVGNHVTHHRRSNMTCAGMEDYRSKQGTLQRYRSDEYVSDSRRLSLQKKKKCRFIKKTGHCNVSHANLRDKPQRFMADIFTTCVDLRWRWNLLLFSTAFIVSWVIFGFIYWVVSYTHGDFAEFAENRPNKSCVNNLDPNAPFTSAFLFSLETQTTIGYGYRVVSEECAFTILMVVVQSVFGCVIDAFMIGLIMAKISRPKKRAETLLFTKNAVINVRDGRMCLMVRVGNLRKSHLVEATIRMQYLHSRTTQEGEFIPLEQIDLHLDLKNDSDRLFLVTPQTICHPIDSDSPLYNISKSSLKDADFEIIVILEGMVEATGMTTQARASYLPSEILWGYRFENVITFSQTNGYNVNFKKFDNTYETAGAPTCSAADLIRKQQELNDRFVDHAQRRSTVSLTKRTVEECSVSDGRDSGYTPAVGEEEDDEDRASDSTKTLSSTSSNGSSFSRGVTELKQRSWTTQRQSADDRSSSENKLRDSAFLPATEKIINFKNANTDDDVTAHVIQIQNEKNVTKRESRNKSQNSSDVNFETPILNNNDQKVTATNRNELDSVISDSDVNTASSPDEIEHEAIVVIIPESEETASLLDGRSPDKTSLFVRHIDNENAQIIDSPV